MLIIINMYYMKRFLFFNMLSNYTIFIIIIVRIKFCLYFLQLVRLIFAYLIH